MNVKAFLFVFLILFLSAPSAVFALGLGSISLKSALDQPLKAQIEVLGAKEQDLSGMDIKLASDAVYKRMGIERNPKIEAIQFAVNQANDGRYFINVQTSKALTEPFVNFLIEVNWSAGRLLREFTILLDPPLTLEEEAPSVEAPKADLPNSFTLTTTSESIPDKGFAISETVSEVFENGQEKQVEALAKADENNKVKLLENKNSDSISNSNKQTPKLAAKSLVYKEVKKNEILWRIAEGMRPQDISVEQMMLALQRQNPQAFYGNTVSHLKAGAVLRIEDSSILKDISVDEAIAEIALQHQEWLASRKSKQAQSAVSSESTNVELEGAGKDSSMDKKLAKVSKESRLKLVTPLEELNDTKEAQTNVTLAASDEKFNRLNVELTLANETVEARKRENEDLLNRLASLDEQMSAMQNLVQLKDAELAKIQSQLSPSSSDMNSQMTGLTMDLHGNESIDKTIIEKKELHSNGIEETVKRLMEDPVTIATIIFIGLFVALIAWVATRTSSVEEESEIYSEKSIDELFPEHVNVGQNRTLITERADVDLSTNSIGIDPLTEVASEVIQMESPSERVLDPVAEADVYLSYDKFDKAELLLRDTIEANPDKQELKLKLLEVYSRKNDLDAFDNQADILYASISGNSNSEIWASAVNLAQKVGSSNPIFAFENRIDESIQHESNSAVDESIWNPEQVTDIENNSSSIEPQTEFVLQDSQVSVAESNAIGNEVALNSMSEFGGREVDFQSQSVISDDELENAMEAFTVESVENGDSELLEQDHAVTEMLKELKSANPDKIFNDENALEDRSLFLLSDEIGTKLDLARAYIEMGDQEGAVDLLNEVMDEGDSQQKNEARELLELS